MLTLFLITYAWAGFTMPISIYNSPAYEEAKRHTSISFWPELLSLTMLFTLWPLIGLVELINNRRPK